MSAPNPRDREKDSKNTGSPGDLSGSVPRLIGWGLGLIGAIGLFAWVLILLRRRREYDPHRSVLELLERARDLESDGVLEPGEYAAIRGEVAARERSTDPARNS